MGLTQRVLVFVALALLAGAAHAEIEGLAVYAAAPTGQPTVDELAAIAAAGADGVVMDLAGEPPVAAVHDAGLKVLASAQFDDALQAAELAATLGFDGLVLLSLPTDDMPADTNPARESGYSETVIAAYREKYGTDPRQAEAGSIEQLLFVDIKARLLTDFMRQVREAAGELPIHVVMLPEDAAAETARWRYLDLHALVGEGLVDGVFFASAQPQDLRRPKLHTDGELVGGIYGGDNPGASFLAALDSKGCDAVLLGPPQSGTIAEMLAVVARSVVNKRAGEDQRAALEAAIEAGEMVAVAEVDPEKVATPNQATIHGVAQSFRLDEPATVQAVGLYVQLRGSNALALEDLIVRICPDADGAPDIETPLAEGSIPAGVFARSGGYNWGYASLEAPPALEAGVTWWIYCPDMGGKGSSYVWRIAPDGGTYPGGHAWSDTYDYEEYDWVFRILSGKQ